MPRGEPVAPEEFFQGDHEARLIHDRVCHVLVAHGVELGLRTTRSQVALRVAEHAFGYLWRPRRYLRAEAAPLVLSIVLDHHVASPRIKQVAHPSARRWLHHIELSGPDDVDAEVTTWLVEAAQHATRSGRSL